MKKTLIFLLVFFAPLVAFAATSPTYVSLTSLPLQPVTTGGGTFAGLFNNIYKICIGLVATLVVFQIMRAGIMYMSAGDNEERLGNAKHLIGNSILGLILVLSPYIVFSIINPNINDFTIGGLNQPIGNTASTGSTGTSGAAASTGTTGSAGTNGTSNTTAQNQYNVTAGTYIWLIGGSNKSNPGCTTLVLLQSPDQSTCQTNSAKALAQLQSTDGIDAQNSITTYYNCVQPANGSFSVPSAGLCTSQPYMQ